MIGVLTDMPDVLLAIVCWAIGTWLEWRDAPMATQSTKSCRRRPSSPRRRSRPRPKPRFTGNVIVLSEYKRRIESKTGGNPATA